MNARDSAQRALHLAERLLDVEHVLATGPTGATLNGLAGTALLHARLATLDPAHARAATQHWNAAASATTSTRPGGIYSSPGGLAASLILGTPYLPDPDIHRATTARAVRWLTARANDIADQHRDCLRPAGPSVPPRAYDTISGLAGIGRVLLAALHTGHDDAKPGLDAALTFLTTMITIWHGTQPAWWLPADHPDNPATSGSANTGMAHGIAGPLAFLSIAHAAGWAITGQDTAISTAADWLLHHRAGTTWPTRVTDNRDDTMGRTAAWCYGSPGISRALTLAAPVTNNHRYDDAAATALDALAARPIDTWDTTGPALCHGHAGVLQAATDCPSGVAHHATAALTGLLDRGGPAHPGFLAGSAGIALTLAEQGQLPAPPTPTRWDALLLLT